MQLMNFLVLEINILPVTIGKKINIYDMNDNRIRRTKKLKTEKRMVLVYLII